MPRIAASMTSYVLVGGEHKKRIALPHARIPIHQLACTFAFTDNDDEDRAGLLYSELEALLATRETFRRVSLIERANPFGLYPMI